MLSIVVASLVHRSPAHDPGDYTQPGPPASFSGQYAREVSAAVQRARFSPERFGAMHVPLTDWKALTRFTGQP